VVVATPTTMATVTSSTGDLAAWGPQTTSLRSVGDPGSWTGRSTKSAWRWPEREGELPLYVQRMFRVKAFGLLSIQLTCIFVEMLLVEAFLRDLLMKYNNLLEQDVFFLTGMATIVLSSLLHYAGSRFPLNYILLLAMTLVVGVFWGTSPHLPDHLHFQLMGILTVLAAGATLLISLTLGWITGCIADLVVVQTFSLSSPLMTWSAMLVTLLVLALVLMLDAGRMLTHCNPDDFARVIVVMDSALLLVSLPIFLLACCFLADAQSRRALGAAVAAEGEEAGDEESRPAGGGRAEATVAPAP